MVVHVARIYAVQYNTINPLWCGVLAFRPRMFSVAHAAEHFRRTAACSCNKVEYATCGPVAAAAAAAVFALVVAVDVESMWNAERDFGGRQARSRTPYTS